MDFHIDHQIRNFDTQEEEKREDEVWKSLSSPFTIERIESQKEGICARLVNGSF